MVLRQVQQDSLLLDPVTQLNSSFHVASHSYYEILSSWALSSYFYLDFFHHLLSF